MTGSGGKAVLEEIRRRLGTDRSAAPEHKAFPSAEPGADLLALFAGRLAAAGGTCEVAAAGAHDVPRALKRHLEGRGDAAVAAADGLERYDWRGAGINFDADRPPAECGVGVTAARCAVAATGSLMVASGVPREIELSLLPPHHVCIVAAGQIVPGVPEAFEKALKDGASPPRNFTLITGPSVTADIEQTIVRGAHGPQSLHVIVERLP